MATANPMGVAEALRDTLDLFLHDHPGLMGVDVDLDSSLTERMSHDPPTFVVRFDGKPFEVCVREAVDA